MFRSDILPASWRSAALIALAALTALTLCWPWFYGAGAAFWYLDYLNTFALAALAGTVCWLRSRKAGASAFLFFALAAILSGAYYLPNFLGGIHGQRSEVAAVFLPALPPALLAVGLLKWPVSKALPRDHQRTLLDGLLVGISFFLLAWALADRIKLPLTAAAPRWLAILPLSTTLGLLVVWAIREQRLLSAENGFELTLVRGAISLIATHHFLSAFLHVEGGYLGFAAQGTEFLNQSAILLLGLAGLGLGKARNALQPPGLEGRWQQLMPGLAAVMVLALSLLLLFSTKDPLRRIYWGFGLSLVVLLLLRQQLLVVDLAELSRSLERKVADRTRELEREHEALRDAQRMQLVAGLAAGLAHDLNGLLGALSLRVDMMRNNASSASALAPHFTAMEEVLDRATGMTRRILSARESNTARPERFDLGQWVRAHRSLFQSLLGEGQQLELDTAGPTPVHMDPDHLAQIAQNLVSNARDAMEGPGRVTLRAVQEEGGTGIACLIVEDTGRGIDPEHMRRIFDPFFTTKPLEKGTGLGLSTVRGLVVQNHGRIRVESAPGNGSRFIVEFPAPPS